jgi:GPH family glycoside/pentoside/hexuronide:cation symporter
MALTRKTKLGFGICDVGGNLFFTVIAFQMASYLTDTVGMAAVYMGLAMMVGRIVDAVTDPLMGYLSDRTRSRWGRRRPYLLFGSVPLFLFMVLMFHNPGIDSQIGLFVWVTIVFCLLSISYTVVNIPYGAMTPELTRDFHERTVLNGYRMSFAVVGTLIGAGAAMPIIQSMPNESAGYRLMGLIFGGIMMVTALITFFTVKEPEHLSSEPVHNRPILREYLTAFKNKPFLMILIPWALFITGVTVASGILKYYFEYVLLNPEGVTLALMFLLLFALGGIPIWVLISRKIGKKWSYIAGMSLFSLGILVLALAGDRLTQVGLYSTMAVAGLGLSTHYIIPYSLIPDAVEWDFVHTGQRREGIYYGLWTLISKLGQALAGLTIGLTLSGSGYVANVAQKPDSILAIRFLTGPIPVVIILAGIIVIRFYPITRKVYEEMINKQTVA